MNYSRPETNLHNSNSHPKALCWLFMIPEFYYCCENKTHSVKKVGDGKINSKGPVERKGR